MEHPFIVSLAEKSIDELQTTLGELNNKLTFAYRSGNGPLINQLQMVIESYKKEYSKKIDDMMKKQNISNQINIQK